MKHYFLLSSVFRSHSVSDTNSPLSACPLQLLSPQQSPPHKRAATMSNFDQKNAYQAKGDDVFVRPSSFSLPFHYLISSLSSLSSDSYKLTSPLPTSSTTAAKSPSSTTSTPAPTSTPRSETSPPPSSPPSTPTLAPTNTS